MLPLLLLWLLWLRGRLLLLRLRLRHRGCCGRGAEVVVWRVIALR
jgi:hypothetical protein